MGSSSPNKGEHKTHVKPPPSWILLKMKKKDPITLCRVSISLAILFSYEKDRGLCFRIPFGFFLDPQVVTQRIHGTNGTNIYHTNQPNVSII